MILDCLRETSDSPAGRVLRINHLRDWWDADDIEFVKILRAESLIDAVMIPKTERASDIDDFIAAVGAHVPVWAVATETPASIEHLYAIAAHRDTVALCWGPDDLAVLMGSFSPREVSGSLRPVYEWVRWQALIAARAAGIEVFDAVFVNIDDLDGLRRECLEAAGAGFSGKIAIHPAQLRVIEEAFRPPATLIDWSTRLLAAQAESGAGAFKFDGQMVDQPHFKAARRLLDAELHSREPSRALDQLTDVQQ